MREGFSLTYDARGDFPQALADFRSSCSSDQRRLGRLSSVYRNHKCDTHVHGIAITTSDSLTDSDSRSLLCNHRLLPFVSHTRKHRITSTMIRLLGGDFTTTRWTLLSFPGPGNHTELAFLIQLLQLCYNGYHSMRSQHETQFSTVSQ